MLGLTLAGFRSFRRAGQLRAGILAGAVAGAITGLVGGLAFLALDQIFIDTVSKQPDKVMNFPTSGYATMLDYLLAHDMPNVAVGLVLGFVGGALLGLLGAGLGRLRTTRSPARRSDGVPGSRP